MDKADKQFLLKFLEPMFLSISLFVLLIGIKTAAVKVAPILQIQYFGAFFPGTYVSDRGMASETENTWIVHAGDFMFSQTSMPRYWVDEQLKRVQRCDLTISRISDRIIGTSNSRELISTSQSYPFDQVFSTNLITKTKKSIFANTDIESRAISRIFLSNEQTIVQLSNDFDGRSRFTRLSALSCEGELLAQYDILPPSDQLFAFGDSKRFLAIGYYSSIVFEFDGVEFNEIARFNPKISSQSIACNSAGVAAVFPDGSVDFRDLDGNITGSLTAKNGRTQARALRQYFHIENSVFDVCGKRKFELFDTEYPMDVSNGKMLTMQWFVNFCFFRIRDSQSGLIESQFGVNGYGSVSGARLQDFGQQVLVLRNNLALTTYDSSTGLRLSHREHYDSRWLAILLLIPIWFGWWISFSIRKQISTIVDQLLCAGLFAFGLYWRFLYHGSISMFWRLEWLVALALLASIALVSATTAMKCFRSPGLFLASGFCLLCGIVAAAFYIWGPELDAYTPLNGNAKFVGRAQWPFQQTLIRFLTFAVALYPLVLFLHDRTIVQNSSEPPNSRFRGQITDVFILTAMFAISYSFLIRLVDTHWAEAVSFASMRDSITWSVLVALATIVTWCTIMFRVRLRLRIAIGVLVLLALWASYAAWFKYLLFPSPPIFQQMGVSSLLVSLVTIPTFVLIVALLCWPEKWRQINEARNASSDAA